MADDLVEIDQRDLVLMSVGTTFALIEQAIEVLDDVPFDQEEIDLMITLPAPVRMRTLARLIELAESARESLRSLDAVIIQLSWQQDDEAAS